MAKKKEEAEVAATTEEVTTEAAETPTKKEEVMVDYDVLLKANLPVDHTLKPEQVTMLRPEGTRNVMVEFPGATGDTVSVPRTEFIRHLFSEHNLSRKEIQILLGGEDLIQYQAVFAATKGMTNNIHEPGSTPSRNVVSEIEYNGKTYTKKEYVRIRVAEGVGIAELSEELGLAKGTISQMATGVKRPEKEKPAKKTKAKKAKAKKEEEVVEEPVGAADEDFDALDDDLVFEDTGEDDEDNELELDDVFDDEEDL